ncbi:MAG: hypothetical protein IPK32_21465 [Verrucomicrobiaceae bacterium]|nr:hypothetical protein [Verrucomicrobiaceae bacterium]
MAISPGAYTPAAGTTRLSTARNTMPRCNEKASPAPPSTALVLPTTPCD